jgi:phage-related tail fiber protein
MKTQIPGKQILDLDIGTDDLKDSAVTDGKLSTTGVSPGDYNKVTVNSKGRVTAGSNPTTLAGHGITDGISTSNTSSNNAPGTVVIRDANGNFSATTIVAGLTGNASTATKLQTARTINGVAFDGSANIQLPAFSGDATSPTGSSVLTLNTIVTPGTYDQVTVNGKGLVTAGFTRSSKITQMFSGTVPAQVGTTTIIPPANSTPTSSMGTLIVTQNITPTATNSIITIDLTGMVDTNFSGGVYITAFRGTTFIGSAFVNTRSGITLLGVPSLIGGAAMVTLKVVDTPGVLTPVTYTIRIGGNAAGTWYLGQDALNTLAGQNKTAWTMTEIS